MKRFQLIEEEILIYRDYIESTLIVVFIKEDNFIIAYNPTLKISGYGDTKDDAIESFGICLDEYIQSFDNNFELEVELNKLGWHQTTQSILIASINHDVFPKTNQQFLETENRIHRTKLLYA